MAYCTPRLRPQHVEHDVQHLPAWSVTNTLIFATGKQPHGVCLRSGTATPVCRDGRNRSEPVIMRSQKTNLRKPFLTHDPNMPLLVFCCSQASWTGTSRRTGSCGPKVSACLRISTARLCAQRRAAPMALGAGSFRAGKASPTCR